MTARTEATKQQRRRRDTEGLQGFRRRLHVAESELDRENFEYRFVNDIGGRVHDFTVKDDWEVVSDRSGSVRADSAGEGSQVAVNAGVGENGRPVRAVLLRKPKAYYNDDYALAQRRIDEKEAGMRNAPGEGSYTPGGKAALSVSVDR
jgi:hypothetical protein